MLYPPPPTGSYPVHAATIAQGAVLRSGTQSSATPSSLQICVAYAVTMSSNHDFQPCLRHRTTINTGAMATAFHVPGKPPLGPWLQVIVHKQAFIAAPPSGLDSVGLKIPPAPRLAFYSADRTALPSSSNGDDLASQFDIAERSFRPQPGRVSSFSKETVDLEERTSVHGPFRNYRDFLTRGLTKAPAVVRRYAVSGHPVNIVIKDQFARDVEISRARKGQADSQTPSVISDAIANRVMPEDLPAILDLLPDSRYFQQIFISDEANPEDDWVTQDYMKGKAPFVSSMAALGDDVMLFKQNRSSYLCRDFLHEWSHALRDKYYEEPLAWGFGYSVDLEGSEWLARPYMARSKGDQWAVLGERLLGQDGKEFLQACEKAPLRSAFFMRALELCLANVDPLHRSVYHDRYLERVRFAKERVLPRALARVQYEIANGTAERKRTAEMILKYMIAENMAEPNVALLVASAVA